MPVFTIYTNVDASKVPQDFCQKATDVVAKAVGKPASYVIVHIIPSQMMSFGGDAKAPCANCNLTCIGRIDPATNKKSSAALSQFLNSTLGIPDDRSYINFTDFAASNVGWSGDTF